MLVTATPAASLFVSGDAHHSSWESVIGWACVVLAAIGFYWVIAALAGRWPFNRPSAPPAESPPPPLPLPPPPPKRVGIVNRPEGKARLRNTSIRNQDLGIDNSGELDADDTTTIE